MTPEDLPEDMRGPIEAAMKRIAKASDDRAENISDMVDTARAQFGEKTAMSFISLAALFESHAGAQRVVRATTPKEFADIVSTSLHTSFLDCSTMLILLSCNDSETAKRALALFTSVLKKESDFLASVGDIAEDMTEILRNHKGE